MLRVRRLTHRAVRSAALCLLFVICEVTASSAEDTDFTPYADAAQYCRGNVPKPLALSPDRRLLCFDGMIPVDVDVSVVTDLAEHGIAVFRSGGGDRVAAARLANALRDRQATIVVWDGCLVECTSFIVLASSETYVLGGAIVAWGVFQRDTDHQCIFFTKADDDTEDYLASGRCERWPSALPQGNAPSPVTEFYRMRKLGREFVDPPESRYVRRALMNLFRSTGQYPVRQWTWNPRYYAGAIKTKIVYQHYPHSQDEVDEMVSRLGMPVRVIHDP